MTIAIIGGGPSGITTAIHIKKQNPSAKVVVLERKERVLKKLLVTGNGRCNMTNINASIKNYFYKDATSQEIEYIEDILENFNVNDVIDFFESIGVVSNVEARGKIYPLSGQASSVVDALRFTAENLGVEIITDFYVTNIEKDMFTWKIQSENKKIITASKVILSAGGKSYPELGSNGSGYELAKKLGHKITELTPTIVQLKTPKDQVKGLQGVKLQTNVTAYSNNKKICTYDGELLFTDYGVSGNVIFNISFVVPIYKEVELEIDFMPQFEYNDLFDKLKKRKKNLNYLSMEYFFNGMLNKKLGQFLLKYSGIEKLSKEISSLEDNEIRKICTILKKYRVKIIDTNGFKNAQVTAGGVSLHDVNLKTLESKKVKGLYFVGEILDVYGECGGFNLQWAWSSAKKVAENFKE